MKKEDYDDGRVLADMSEMERRPLLFPHLHRPEKKKMNEDRPVLSEEDAQELRSVRGAAIGGAVLAGLVIVGVITVGIIIVVLIILLLGKLNGSI